MRFYKIRFTGKMEIITGMNATLAEATAYYVGKEFNLGAFDDNMQTGLEVREVRV